MERRVVGQDSGSLVEEYGWMRWYADLGMEQTVGITELQHIEVGIQSIRQEEQRTLPVVVKLVSKSHGDN